MKYLIYLVLATSHMVPNSAFSQDWTSDSITGAQGVHGAEALNAQNGLFDLRFTCSTLPDHQNEIFMNLKTLPDAPLQLGNETDFPITLGFMFADGRTESFETLAAWNHQNNGVNVWHSTIPLDGGFLNSFAGSIRLEIRTVIGKEGELIFTYFMRGSAKAAGTLHEYCYSGNYN
ncbi:hypothetical protein MACH17_06210 [Phaeobacter inhibens]|uniref:hypothetical protein n=1 Tax=Phaeobacter inhibens TaxID=221822 RepID=UPI0027558C0E|nr:hypothetical protein [Phaeobacter inhibens]GLO69104.1 hypothetical protein MACH17_06210 [Phaeobacter inhibens]